jgi:hypothetical protein
MQMGRTVTDFSKTADNHFVYNGMWCGLNKKPEHVFSNLANFYNITRGVQQPSTIFPN